MKIAILINTFYKGKGMDYVAEQQAEMLIKEGFDITVFTFESDNSHGSIPVEILSWPHSPIINFIYRIIFPLDFLKIYRFSNKLSSYDVIISHFYPMTYLAFITKKRYPTIKNVFYNHGIGDSKIYYHSIDSFIKSLLSYLFINYIRLMTNISITNVDCVISISKFMQRSLSKKKRNYVVYNKINPNKFKYDGSEISEKISGLLKNRSDGPILLYVGVIRYRKGILQLIDAFKKILTIYPHATLILIGKIDYRFNINDIVNKYTNNIFYLGTVSDSELGYLYNNCDVYVSASTWESFNLPLVEAQSFGKPVVAFNIGAHAEVVDNGKSGILVQPSNTDMFADAVITAYKNKETMGNHAKPWSNKFLENNELISIINTLR